MLLQASRTLSEVIPPIAHNHITLSSLKLTPSLPQERPPLSPSPISEQLPILTFPIYTTNLIPILFSLEMQGIIYTVPSYNALLPHTQAFSYKLVNFASHSIIVLFEICSYMLQILLQSIDQASRTSNIDINTIQPMLWNHFSVKKFVLHFNKYWQKFSH